MTQAFFSFALGSVLATVPAAAAGPNLSEALKLVRAECPAKQFVVRRFACKGFEEEPSEFACAYEVRQPDKGWHQDNLWFATDGKGWHLTDGPSYCPGRRHGFVRN